MGFYKCNVHKYNFGNLTTSEQTKLCGPTAISGASPGEGLAQVGNHCTTVCLTLEYTITNTEVSPKQEAVMMSAAYAGCRYSLSLNSFSASDKDAS